SGIEKVGGLVGDNWGSNATIITCLWDIETSGLTDMCGIQRSGASGYDDTYGKTTIEMQTASTFLDAGWDFVNETTNGTDDIWKITEGLSYPRLWWEKYGGGMGEPNDPYLIYTAEQLNTIGLNKEDADKHFKLMDDIDLSAYQGDSFNRIGSYDPPPTVPQYWRLPFTGVFDGNNHTISNFTYVVDVNEPPSWGYDGDWDVGLFGVINGPQAQIKNLGLIDPNIYPAATCSERVSRVGVLAGDLRQGSITNCYVKGGRVSADTQVGGLIGSNSGTISNCYTTCDVTWAKDRWLRPIEEPWGNTGTSFGGFAGGNSGQIYNCYATGRIEADSTVGGLVGGNSYDEYYEIVISDSYATGDVSGIEAVGGLVGRNSDTIRRCCAFGSVSGMDMVGGLVGINNRLGKDQYVGIVTNSYAMSRISGNNHVGGMAGVNMGMLIESYSASEVSGTSNVGGFVGTNRYLSKDGTAENCFWDFETSGQWESKGGIGKTTAEMQTGSTFLGAGWDFVNETANGTEDIWWILEGQNYPRLWWEAHN
ncbi:MAG: GLUG motif-containing protein, partial [Planctomycetota bacterium]